MQSRSGKCAGHIRGASLASASGDQHFFICFRVVTFTNLDLRMCFTQRLLHSPTSSPSRYGPAMDT